MGYRLIGLSARGMLQRRFAIACFLMLTGSLTWAAPGDIRFQDNFDNGGLCGTLAPNWTTTNTNLGGISTQTSNSPNCSMFVRGTVVENTSTAVDLSGAIGADLSMWVRIGSDVFSEDPDAGEDMVVEFLNSTGFWIALETFPGGGNFGGIFNRTYEIPASGLHAGFQFRVRHTGGNGGPPANGGIGFDYYHVDDVLLVETGVAPPPPTPSNLGPGVCDDFESGFNNWQTTNSTRSAINGDTFNSASNSLFVRHGAVTTTATQFSSLGVSDLEVWVRRGADAFSENPEGGENLTIEYFNNLGTWVALETFPGGGTQGQIFDRSYALPDSARHANFSVRFSLSGGSGVDFDYWHMDDVCLVAGTPNIAITKNVTTEQDPVNGTSNPFNIPGAWAVYEVIVTNTSIGLHDSDSLVIEDELDPNTTFFTGDFDGSGSPFRFTDGSGGNASGLTLPFVSLTDPGDGVEFLDAGGSPVVPISGFDPAVRRIRITFPGQLLGSTDTGSPTFTLEYRVLID